MATPIRRTSAAAALAAPPSAVPRPEAPPARLARLGWRALRIAAALALLTLSFWSLLIPTAFPISDRAVLTARVAILRAPIDGEIGKLRHDIGDRVGEGDVLCELRNDSVALLSEIGDLTTRQRQLKTRLEARRSEQAVKLRQLERYESLLREHSSRLSTAAELTLQEATARLETARQAKASKEAELARLERMHQRNLLSDAEWARLVAERDAAATSVDARLSEVARLQEQLRNVGDGFFIGGEADPPPFLQLREDVGASLVELQVELDEAEGDLASLEAQLRSAEQRLARLSDSTLRSPADGVVWRRLAGTGQHAVAGEELFQIADESTVFAQVFLHRRYVDRVAVGDRARLFLIAEGSVVAGEVAYMQVTDERQRYDTFAVDVDPPDREHFEVVIRLDPGERQAQRIGQLARVVVLGPETSLFHETLARLSLRL